MSTLIVYATKHGAAGRCASMLSEKLSGKVDMYNLKDGANFILASYDKVVIGGSIYAGMIRKEIKEFCRQNINTLKSKKLGLYICCMFKENAETYFNSSFPQELLEKASAIECFGGEMRFSDMNFAERFITKMVSKAAAKNDPNAPDLDMKKDISMLSEEAIGKFAELMNKA